MSFTGCSYCFVLTLSFREWHEQLVSGTKSNLTKKRRRKEKKKHKEKKEEEEAEASGMWVMWGFVILRTKKTDEQHEQAQHFYILLS